MLAGAAFAGLIAGSGAAVKASTLLPSLKAILQRRRSRARIKGRQEDDKQVKEKHALARARTPVRARAAVRPGTTDAKAKTSCKGKAAAHDGSKKPQ